MKGTGIWARFRAQGCPSTFHIVLKSVDLSSSGNFPIHSFLKNQKFRHMLDALTFSVRRAAKTFFSIRIANVRNIGLHFYVPNLALGGRIMYGNICWSEGMLLPLKKSLPLHFPREKGPCPFICFVRKK